MLKGVLTSARISGCREYHGEIVADSAWPEIITPGDFDELRALLTRPGLLLATARRYLYSGILQCWQCHKGLCGRPHNGRGRYQCAKAPGNGRCGTVAVYSDLADAGVRDKVLTALDSPKLFARIMTATRAGAGTRDITDQLRGIDTQCKELAAMWAAKELIRPEWMSARDALQAEADTRSRAWPAASTLARWPSSPPWTASYGNGSARSPMAGNAPWSPPPSPTSPCTPPASTPYGESDQARKGAHHPTSNINLPAARPPRRLRGAACE